MKTVMGIDLGTTSISMILMDTEKGTLVRSVTIQSRAFLPPDVPGARIQDPEKILELVIEGMKDLCEGMPRPDAIGMTGQMHGFLFTDAHGKAVSPLYTWQDDRGNLPVERDLKGNETHGKTPVQILKEKGMLAAAGYGVTTYFALALSGKVPETAVSMTTVSDFVAMRLCGNTKPLIAPDMAASWGCFDLEKLCFETAKLQDLGLDVSLLPQVLDGHEAVGRVSEAFTWAAGAPVSASLGDNQASFLGSVKSPADTVLINIGTGSQVSFSSKSFLALDGSIDLRPCTQDMYLLAGSGLCGGRSYALLEGFYREFLEDVFGEKEAVPEVDLYAVMARHARKFLDECGTETVWNVNTSFNGTRNDPSARGSIEGIGTDNFRPGALTAGMLKGMLQELYDMYAQMCRLTGRGAVHMVGSGNAIRKNPLLQEMAENMFGMKLDIPAHEEEAACGAAFQAMASAGIADSLEDAQQMITYCS